MSALLPVPPHLGPQRQPHLPQLLGDPPVHETWWIIRKRPGEPS
jgi:hypothetical protein